MAGMYGAFFMKNAQAVKIVCCVSLYLLLAIVSVSEAITPLQLSRIKKIKVDVEELFKEGNYKQAIPLLENILLINPADKTASRYLMFARQQMVEPFCKQADEAYLKRDYQEAIDIWEKILEIHPDDMRVEKMIEFTRNMIQDNVLDSLFELAENYIKEGRYDLAIDELEKILLISPDDRHARELLISSRQAIVNTRINNYYEKAEKFMKAEKYDLAIDAWEKILDIDKDQEAASRLIAEARRIKLNSMYSEAKQLYEKGIYTTSQELYSKILAENPTDLDTREIVSRLNETVNIVQKIEGEGEVMDLLRKALINHISTSGNIKAAIVASWFAMQKSPESKLAAAIKEFLERKYPTEVLSLEPPMKDMDIVEQYLFAALNHIYEGRYDLAVLECSIVVELQPQNTLALKRLGSAYFAIEDKVKAKEAWERALELSPDDKELKSFIKLVR
jgi:tetratricopeptide (TPR) repeat protein